LSYCGRARARAAACIKERKRVESTVIPKMRQEIAHGVDSNRAIAKAQGGCDAEGDR
jgi:hypothetical protein